MGLQIHIELADLQKADCRVDYDSYVDEESNEWHRAMITLNESGEVFYMETNAEHSYFWNDYNEWGSNRSIIEPKVQKLGVKHVVC